MIEVRPFTASDLALGNALSTQAGWNQLPADWQRTWELEPALMFVGMLDGRAVGTVAACLFDDVAWVALMLVAASARGQGVGRALMSRVLRELDDRHVATIRLDATPLGQPLYEKLGFTFDYALQRYAGRPRDIDRSTSPATAELDAGPLDAEKLDLAIAFDSQVTATRRGRFLNCLFRENPSGARAILSAGECQGLVMQRAGRLGTLVGPCLGDSRTGAVLLTSTLASLMGQSVLVDIPDDHEMARSIAGRFGLSAVRTLTRMTRGKKLGELRDHLWASSGPEKG